MPDFVVRDGKSIDLRYFPKLWPAFSENGPDLEAPKLLWSGVDGAVGITILNFGFSSIFSTPTIIGLLHQDAPIPQHSIPGPFLVLKGIVTTCSARDEAMNILHGGQVGLHLVERLLSIEQLPFRSGPLPNAGKSAQGHPLVLWPMAKRKGQPESTYNGEMGSRAVDSTVEGISQ